MAYVFPPHEIPSVAVSGDAARFAVRRIFCVGRNYREHAKEMGSNPDREPPFFFTKPADALVDGDQKVAYPLLTANFHYEGELVLAVGKGGVAIAAAQALDHVYGYAVGNDLTRRDLQLAAREKGRPWDWGKAFDRSAVCGPIHPVARIGHLSKGLLQTRVNDQIKQSADIADMIWNVPDTIAFLSASVALQPGDLIYTGTPAGVGALVPGDICKVSIEGLGILTTTIVERQST
jgi:fumarylpyruvate hydrolase